MVIFRNNHIATGVSNSYGDGQDLYVETVDPQDPSRYLEGGRSLPFEVIEETLAIKDKTVPGGMRHETVAIRRTRRGPVVSGLLPGLETERVVTLRWSPQETMGATIGLERLIQAHSAQEVRDALSQVSIVMLNFIFADVDGNIGWQATGKLPVRSRGDGTLPLAVTDGEDNWRGWIPFDRMPGAINPAKGWLGACNHRTVGEDFPYYYSSYFAPSNRYRRLKELVESDAATTAEDHWLWQLDTLNVTARAVTPKITAYLVKYPETAETAQILSDWDFRDDPARVAPTLYHAIFLCLTRRVLANVVGEAALEKMLDDPYLWQERIEREVLSDDSPFFDDPATAAIETFGDVVLASALQAQTALAETLGTDRRKWLWGRLHQMQFLNPIRRSGIGAEWLGGGIHPAPGSSATLNRGRYDFNRPYQVVVSAAMRVVFDLADPDKITAVLAGGVSGRTFSPHQTDQIAPFLSGEKRYWWFSNQTVAEHSVSKLTLTPADR
jgi:penicillin amidase